MTNKTDTERRRKLNAELMKERANFKDDTQCTYEATQTLNPITGKQYEDNFMTVTDMGRIEQEANCKLKENILKLENNVDYFLKPKDIPAFNMSNLCEKYSDYVETKETSTEYLDYQRALAIKEVREGRMSEGQYAEFLYTFDSMVAAYNKSPELTLQTIRDAEGLNLALSKIEELKERELAEKPMYWGISLHTKGSFKYPNNGAFENNKESLINNCYTKKEY